MLLRMTLPVAHRSLFELGRLYAANRSPQLSMVEPVGSLKRRTLHWIDGFSRTSLVDDFSFERTDDLLGQYLVILITP